jgi:hypothetical protein
VVNWSLIGLTSADEIRLDGKLTAKSLVHVSCLADRSPAKILIATVPLAHRLKIVAP